MNILSDKKINYLQKVFDKMDLASKPIKDKTFEGCDFKNCNFDNATFINCKFIDCEFTNCSLNTIVPTHTSFSNINFDNTKLMGINWPMAQWPQIKLYSLIHFYSCDISHSSFFGLNLSEINLQNCKAHDVDFREADLSNSYLMDTDFFQSLFIKTKLNSANFSGAINYNIDIKLNTVKNAIFTFPDVINLLHHFEIKIDGLSDKM